MSDIVISNLSLCTPAGVLLVEDAHFTLKRGEIALLVGPSACGKSSVAHCLCGLLDQDAWGITGQISFDNATIPLAAQRRDMAALVMQTSALFDDMSLVDNVRIAADYASHSSRISGEALALVSRINPDVAPSDASGGMRQRIAILRALATGRHLIILDEPNSGLDPFHAKLLAEGLRAIADETGAAILIIAHHIENLMPLCASMLLLDPVQKRLQDLPRTAQAFDGALARIAATEDQAGGYDWAHKLANKGHGWWGGLALLRNFVLLGLSPLAMIYVALGGIITGATAVLLAFSYRSVGRYLVPLLHDEILARVAVVELTIAVPLIASLLLTCRNNAVIAARMRLFEMTGQRDAMINIGLSLTRLIIMPVLLASAALSLLLGAVANVAAAAASLAAWVYIFPDQFMGIWRDEFFDPYLTGGRLGMDFATTTLKLVLSAVVSAGLALLIGLKRDKDPDRGQAAISDSIIAGALATLIIHAAITVFAVLKLQFI